jgi:hypothetical protein
VQGMSNLLLSSESNQQPSITSISKTISGHAFEDASFLSLHSPQL